MFDFALLFFMLARQFMMPLIVTATSLWSWAYFGDTALVPQTKIGRQAQELIYNVKFHPITKGIVQFLSTQDFSDEIRDITNTIQNHTGLERVNAIKALGMLEEESASSMPMLVWSLYDENEEVRKTAIESIERIMANTSSIKSTEELTPMLIQLRSHPDNGVREIISSLLKATGYVTVPGTVDLGISAK